MKTKKNKPKRIQEFNFEEDTVLAGKYRIVEHLGTGWESEVYKIAELRTGIERAAKFFYPHRNLKNQVAARYAKKLHKLSNCPIVIKYHTQEIIPVAGHKVTCLISEYVEGELLSGFLDRQKGKRIGIFQGLHLLYALASGLESMHQFNEYHGDLHTDNIILSRYGLGFDIKLLDFYTWSDYSRKANMGDDICNSIRIFYDAIGGPKRYPKHPQEVKEICLGLKRNLILKKFKTAGHLKQYLRNIQWKSIDRI